MYKVKKCPCCGKIESVKIRTKFIQNGLSYRVICDDMTDGCGIRTAWYRKIDDAINNWNRRELTDESVCVRSNEGV